MDKLGEGPELTRVQCGQCAWMSEPHESAAEAYLEVGAHFVNVHRYAATAAPVVAAPPTAAQARPAREVAHDAVKPWWNAPYPDGMVNPPFELVSAVTEAIERDRASRSPGPVTALPGSLHGACVDPACRGYWDSQIAAITAHNEHNAPVWAELERIAQRAVDLSASAGLGGRLRPGSDEGAAGKAHGAPLSGLDAATVEAARLAWEKVKRIVGKLSMPDEFWDDTEALDDAIRALATPPGQAK